MEKPLVNTLNFSTEVMLVCFVIEYCIAFSMFWIVCCRSVDSTKTPRLSEKVM